MDQRTASEKYAERLYKSFHGNGSSRWTHPDGSPVPPWSEVDSDTVMKWVAVAEFVLHPPAPVVGSTLQRI